MKNLFLSLAFMLVSSFSFASTGEVKNDVLKPMPYIIMTSCGATVQGVGDFTVDEFFDLMDAMESALCG
ncbi:hypothetical protein [Flavobacterium sp. N2270]|uniref:hypothetical protein n=1 Tax=Flavobacterium sp. N2270 TaxID=2986831 RepID=UPI002224ADFC|nr:hypothetical protein [Flavobacterium sp. N2270]